MKANKLVLSSVATGLMVLASDAGAATVGYLGSGNSTSGQGISASALFDANGSKLTITLENTWLGLGGTKDDAALLVGVLFSGLDGLSLSGASAWVPAGEQTWKGTAGTTVGAGGLNVGGEWGYKVFSSAVNGATAGLSSSGLSGLFGNGNLNGANLEGNANKALGGADYGLVSANYNAANANNGLKGVTTVNNSTVFTFNYAGNLDKLGNVQFAYGTLPNSYLTGVKSASGPKVSSEAGVSSVPDGGNSLLLFSASLMGIGLLGRKKSLGTSLSPLLN